MARFPYPAWQTGDTWRSWYICTLTSITTGLTGQPKRGIFLTEVLSAAPHVPVQVAHLAGAGGYDDPATDAALSVFIDAISHHDPRVSHLCFDISGVAGLGEWESKKQLIASRIRQVGVDRILFGSDGAWTDFAPIRAEAAFHELPLTREEVLKIDNNLPPYMPRPVSSPPT